MLLPSRMEKEKYQIDHRRIIYIYSSSITGECVEVLTATAQACTCGRVFVLC